MTCNQARKIGIPSLMAAIGLQPLRHDGNGSWYHSPWSDSGDRHPSFQVSLDGRRFHDWSCGVYGDIIDLARRLLGCESVPVALHYIESLASNDNSLTISANSTSADKKKKEPGIVIDEVAPIRDRRLMGYAWGRGIHRNILTEYCYEVHYHLAGRPDRPFYAIGWRNDSGGYELRNALMKQCAAPKDITTIGDMAICPCLVLEGFFDFLSAVALGLYNPLEMNAIVLNSTAMTDRAIVALKNMSASRVMCMLDHDDAGRAAMRRIIETLPHAKDYSSFYPHKDLNDYLLDTKSINDSYHKAV